MAYQIEQQFNSLLDACNTYRADIGPAADMISLGRALEQLSLGTPLLRLRSRKRTALVARSDHCSTEQGVATKCHTERALLDWHFANLECALVLWLRRRQQTDRWFVGAPTFEHRAGMQTQGCWPLCRLGSGTKTTPLRCGVIRVYVPNG